MGYAYIKGVGYKIAATVASNTYRDEDFTISGTIQDSNGTTQTGESGTINLAFSSTDGSDSFSPTTLTVTSGVFSGTGFQITGGSGNDTGTITSTSADGSWFGDSDTISIVGEFEASDDYSGSGTNSGTVGDTWWTRRGYAFTKDLTPADPTINAGRLRATILTADGNARIAAEMQNVPDQATGSMSVDIVLVTQGAFAYVINPTMVVNSVSYGAGYNISAGTKEWFVQKNGVTQWSAATVTTEATVKWTWDGVNVKVFFDGVEKFSEANSGDGTGYFPLQVDHFSGTGDSITDFDNVVILDGSGDPTTIAF